MPIDFSIPYWPFQSQEEFDAHVAECEKHSAALADLHSQWMAAYKKSKENKNGT